MTPTTRKLVRVLVSLVLLFSLAMPAQAGKPDKRSRAEKRAAKAAERAKRKAARAAKRAKRKAARAAKREKRKAAKAARKAKKRAVELYEKGMKLYKRGLYRQAIALFKEAHGLVNKPVLLYNIASCHERLGEFPQAVTFYLQYIKVCPPDERDKIQSKIDNIRKRPSTLRVVTAPAGAKVWLNGKLQPQRTPASFTVQAGRVKVRVKVKGFKPKLRTLQAGFGRPLVAVFTLDKRPPQGMLKVTANLPGAWVWLDGKPMGKPPLEKIIRAGSHVLTVTKPGHKNVVRRFRLADGGAYTITAKLEPKVTAPGPGPGGESASGTGTTGTVKKRGPVRPLPGPAASAIFVGAGGGLAVPAFGDSAVKADPTYSVAVSGGYMLRVHPRLGLELGARFSVSSMNDVTLDRSDALTFLDVSALVGLRIFILNKLFTSVRLGAGMAAIMGLDHRSFLFEGLGPEDKVDSTFTGLSIWGSVLVGYRLWRGLAVCLVPAAVEFSPKIGPYKDFANSVRYVLRYNVQASVMYDF